MPLLLFGDRPAVDIAPTKLDSRSILRRRVMEGVMAKLVAGGVALPVRGWPSWSRMPLEPSAAGTYTPETRPKGATAGTIPS